MSSTFLIRPQQPDDFSSVTALHEQAFGPGRFARSAYRVREASHGPEIALTAWHGGTLAGAIQLTAVTVGGHPGAMLLGPLAVAPDYKGKGCGMRLIQESLAAAKAAGKRFIVLVGDLPYYARAGFTVTPAGRIILPGPADPSRILGLELHPGALADYAGLVTADNAPAVAMDADGAARVRQCA
jgi:predicted N-acetyltransferase YhbS